MVTIGINGNPGAGKSTFSEMIFQDTEKVRLVHLDRLVDKLKEVVPSNIMKRYSRDNGEVIQYLKKDSLLYKIKNQKYLNVLYEKLKSLYIRREIKRIKESSIIEGIEYLIFEGAVLEQYFKLDELTYLILINVDFDRRKARIMHRDRNLDDDAEAMADVIANITSDDSIQYDYIVNNVGTLADLQAQAYIITNMIKNPDVMVRRRENKKITRNY